MHVRCNAGADIGDAVTREGGKEGGKEEGKEGGKEGGEEGKLSAVQGARSFNFSRNAVDFVWNA
eukprot:669937-Rhodomonas_salina.1